MGVRNAKRMRRGAYSAVCITYELNKQKAAPQAGHMGRTCCRSFILPDLGQIHIPVYNFKVRTPDTS